MDVFKTSCYSSKWAGRHPDSCLVSEFCSRIMNNQQRWTFHNTNVTTSQFFLGWMDLAVFFPVLNPNRDDHCMLWSKGIKMYGIQNSEDHIYCNFVSFRKYSNLWPAERKKTNFVHFMLRLWATLISNQSYNDCQRFLISLWSVIESLKHGIISRRTHSIGLVQRTYRHKCYMPSSHFYWKARSKKVLKSLT